MMCTGKQEEQGECSQGMNNIIHQNIQTLQDHNFLLQNQIMQQQQQQQQQNLIFQSDQNHHHHHHHHNHNHHQVVPQILHQPWSIPNFNPNPTRFDPSDPFLIPPPPQPSPYAGLFARRANPSLQFGYDGPSNSDHHHHHLRILSDTIVGVGPTVHPGSVGPFGLQSELGKMTAQEIMDAKALAASKSHSEAERRRRERINNHLAKLRSLLPSTTKTDKASLLAEVIQHVKELKRQTSLIAETSPVPTETDELTVDDASSSDGGGQFVIKASLCCDDRSDLIPDLIKTLKGLRLRTLKAEITTLGGRVKNVLFVTGDEDSSYSGDDCQNHDQDDDHDDHDDHNNQPPQYCITSIQEALKAVIEKKNGDNPDSSSGSVKRQRTASNNINIYT